MYCVLYSVDELHCQFYYIKWIKNANQETKKKNSYLCLSEPYFVRILFKMHFTIFVSNFCVGANAMMSSNKFIINFVVAVSFFFFTLFHYMSKCNAFPCRFSVYFYHIAHTEDYTSKCRYNLMAVCMCILKYLKRDTPKTKYTSHI